MTRRLSIATKFFLTYFVITGAALAFAGMAGYVQFKRYALDEADRALLLQARLVAEAFRPHLAAARPDRARIAAEGDRLGRDADVRLTIVLPDGTVAADSIVGSAGLSDMENHAERPEIASALAGGPGFASRRSITVREEERYCAVPVVAGGKIVGAARTAIPFTHLARRLDRIRVITWGTGTVAFILMLAGTAFRAKRVTGPLDEMRGAARDLAAGNLSRRVRVRTGDELEEMGQALNHMSSRLEQTIHQLDAGKARLSTLLENLSEGVIVVGEGRTVRMLNREAARILDVAEVHGDPRPLGGLIRQPDVLAAVDAWRRHGAGAAREVVVHAKGGDRIVRLAGTAVRHEGEGETDLLLTLRDVTEERRLARIKSDFVSNASHELRTPLTNVRGYLEAMEDSVREGGIPDPSFLAVALSNTLRMQTLVDDLLTLSRAESGASPLAVAEIPLPAFLEGAAAMHRAAAQKAGKTIAVRAEDAVLRADREKLSLAVSNLVDNAIKYGKEGGKVTLGGRAEGESIVLEVSDDGPGIPAEHLPRIFERFYRVDAGRSRELGGTGLGLSIAKHIVESHGGTIRAESRLGVGTTFRIRLPA